jgi:DHA1 family bicyclomycin/chloramphenicol resistance-like MFS transporter
MDWRGLFLFMAGLGIMVTVWVFLRLPETLKPENRRPFGFRAIIEGFGIVFSNRIAIAYIIGTALLFGALIGFLNSSQQIYVGIYGVGVWFPAYFAAGAAFSAMAGFINSQLVNRFGMRKISHTALLAFCSASALMLLLATIQLLPLYAFFTLATVLFFTFSMIMPNFGALAMEPLGEVAGTAASAQGFLQMVLGAGIGTLIGLQFNNTTIPMAAGFLVLGLCSAALIAASVRHRSRTDASQGQG